MCPPTAYGVKYEINPWMHIARQPDLDLAASQWRKLYQTLTENAGATVELIEQALETPDMVFTANAGLVVGNMAVVSRFRHAERQGEERWFRAWFEAAGYNVLTLPDDCYFEGEGDALMAGDRLVAGYLKRSDIASHMRIADWLHIEVLSLELTDDRWYHLDTCFFPLDGATVAYHPEAFDRYAREVIRSNFQTIEVNAEEAARFACNAVSVGNSVVLPAGCPELAGRLEQLGRTVFSVDLSEFLKAGGAAKCLALYAPEPVAAVQP
ncbi:MAG: amidinotransferase [Armatimonadetes bacterium]|nr:amidinotransferase [Armatimonadota bacterium]MDE2207924.1 amidinotransferase [Armatimonadota bacterium]